jgi:hypothetical protein
MRIKDNKTRKREGLPKLNMEWEGCPMLAMEAEWHSGSDRRDWETVFSIH